MKTRKLRLRAKWIAGIVLVLALTLLAGTTSFSKQPPHRYPLGDIPLDEATYQKYLKTFPRDMAEALPSAYDARAEGIVTPAKNQGSCGSCWAFAKCFDWLWITTSWHGSKKMRGPCAVA